MFALHCRVPSCLCVCVCACGRVRVCIHVLQVESTCVADQMWYFPLLVPFRDHVPVKSDLSDLQEKIAYVTLPYITLHMRINYMIGQVTASLSFSLSLSLALFLSLSFLLSVYISLSP